MKLAVMQPYLFPYLGYYQLVGAVDTFVFFDDVNYINKGWINRNNILSNGKAQLFTLPLKKASQNKLINETEILDYDTWREQFLKQIEFSYKKAPYYEAIFPWLQNILNVKSFQYIAGLASYSVRETAKLIGLSTQFSYSSSLDYRKDSEMNGQEKVLSICRLLNTQQYINPKNGTELYDRDTFEKANIKLNFIQMNEIEYPQFKNEFVPFLSIIDVLFFNGVEKTRQLINQYQLN